VLLAAEVDGERLSQQDVDLFFLLLMNAGSETTRNLITGGMLTLFAHPEERARLQADAGLIPGGVEEMLRYVTPVMHFRRTAREDVHLGGQAICAGDKVVVWYVSANRDDEQFPDPDRFDVTRSPNEHVAFGAGGPHFCLGAGLARLEARVLFEELLARLPALRPDGPVRRLRSNFINGVKSLPVAAA
jgi:cytochrome P450